MESGIEIAPYCCNKEIHAGIGNQAVLPCIIPINFSLTEITPGKQTMQITVSSNNHCEGNSMLCKDLSNRTTGFYKYAKILTLYLVVLSSQDLTPVLSKFVAPTFALYVETDITLAT